MATEAELRDGLRKAINWLTPVPGRPWCACSRFGGMCLAHAHVEELRTLLGDNCWCGRAWAKHDPTDETDHDPNPDPPSEVYARLVARAESREA